MSPTHTPHAPIHLRRFHAWRLVLVLAALLAVAPSIGAQETPPSDPQPAQTDAPSPKPGLGSPRETLETFLSAMSPALSTQQRELEQAARCIEFPPGLLASAKNQTAIELYEVLNRLERIEYSEQPVEQKHPT